MRKSRFLLNLIAATAIGLSTIGCGGGADSGAIMDTTDLTVPNNGNAPNEQRNLREYMLIAQRGLDTFAPSYEAGSGESSPSTPDITGRQIVASPGDGAGVEPTLLFELLGIGDTPNPNAQPVAPGTNTVGGSNSPGAIAATETTGYHQVYASPNGDYCIGMSRAKNRGTVQGDPVEVAVLQVYALNIEAPLDQVYPPNIVFGNPADPLPIRFFPPDQGEFVSGAWSSTAQQFYASIENAIAVYAFNGVTGRIDEVQIVPFPVGGAGVNNAAQLIVSANGAFVWALDNANAQIVTYARDAADGTLTQIATMPTVADVRSATVDRSGRFMYVLGRSSQQVAGYSIGADGSLTPFDLFPDIGVGPIPFDFGDPLGDVAANPRNDTIFLATYAGIVQGYSINTTNGSWSAVGNADGLLNNARNLGNIEVEPTGRFLVTTFEHDFESLLQQGQAGDQVFANTDSASNSGAGGVAFSATPNFDANGRIVFVAPDRELFTGELQIWRIGSGVNGGPRAEEAVQTVVNPYGISFFQKVLTPPSGVGPIQL